MLGGLRRVLRRVMPRTARARLARVRRSLGFYTLDEGRFVELLREFGFRPGAVVMLHSSMDSITDHVRTMSASRLIGMLIDLVGVEGTILMPAFPFRGFQMEYLLAHRQYDPRRAPVTTGLLPGLFVRRPDVVRSLHPTHSVAAWGKHARELVRLHHLGPAVGETSPFCRLREFGGIAVTLGTEALTLFHVAEWLHPKTRSYHYAPSTYPVTIVTGAQRMVCEVQPMRMDRRRRYHRARRILIKQGVIRQAAPRGLYISSTEAGEFIERCLTLIESGAFDPNCP